MLDPRLARPRRSSRCFVLVGGLVGLLSSSEPAFALGPAPEVKVSEQDLEQSKQLYAKGLAALDARDYSTAQSHFTQAYRLAPHLHLFNYNIAMAAGLRGDCKAAQQHYQAFLDLVPKHPERRAAQRALKKLQATCPVDDESEAVLSPEDRAKRDEQRKQERAHEAMNDALDELRRSAAFYDALAASFPKERAFKRATKASRKGAARMAKLLASHQVPEVTDGPAAPKTPASIVQACRMARVQAERTIDALERSLELYDTKESIRVLQRLLRRADRDQVGFDECAG